MRRAVATVLIVAFSSLPSVFADGHLNLDAAVALLRQGKQLTPEQLKEIQSLLEVAEKSGAPAASAKYAQVLLDRSNGKRVEARKAAERLAKDNPMNAEYHATYGTLCFETIGDAGLLEKSSLASKGRAEYEKAIELDPLLIEPRVGLGRFYLMAPGYAGGSSKKAEEQARGLIALPEGKGEFAGRTLLADIYADKSDWEKMEKEYEVLEAAGGDNVAAAMRAHAQSLLNKKKDPKAALVVLERYQRAAAPDDASPWYLTAEARRALGEIDGAVAGYEKAIQINPAALNSRYALAELLEKAGKYAEAADQYREFVKRFPSDGRASKASEAAERCSKKAK